MTTGSVQLLRERVKRWSEELRFIPLLAMRVVLGVIFAGGGWGKFQNLDTVTGFFTNLGIPAPSVMATVVAACEFGCGLLLLLGVASRLAAVPLMVIMIVALATAKRSEIHGVTDLFGVVDLTYLVMLFTVFVMGPGAVSVDAAIAHKIENHGSKEHELQTRQERPLWET